MKSINEKAEEYVDNYYQKLGISKDEYPIDVEITKADFEAGANYVLEIIEDIISNPRRYISADVTVSEGMINGIVERINELKK